MNCMSSKIRRHKEQMAYEREKAEEEKYINSLTEEERAEYHKNEKERGIRAMRLLASLVAASAGAYSSLSGITGYEEDGEQE